MTSYTRVSDNLFDSSLWSDGSYEGCAALKLFLALLGEARRQHGKVRRLTIAKAARVGAIPLELAKEAIDRLTGPDQDDSSGVAEGRRLLPDPDGGPNDFIVTNWEAYGESFARANAAERQYRKRMRDGERDASVTPSRPCHYEEKREKKEKKEEESKTGRALKRTGHSTGDGSEKKPRKESARDVALRSVVETIARTRPAFAEFNNWSALAKLLSEFGEAGLTSAAATVDDWSSVNDPLPYLRGICLKQLERGGTRAFAAKAAASHQPNPQIPLAAPDAALNAVLAAEALR